MSKSNLEKHFSFSFQFLSWLPPLWFPILFTILCLFTYEWGIFHKEQMRNYLEQKHSALLLEQQTETAANAELNEELSATNDPEWIEMMIKKHLGVINSEETKIVFQVKE